MKTAKSNTKDYLKKIVTSATKKVGYKAGKGKHFLGSLPVGSVFETNSCTGTLLNNETNAQVQIFNTRDGMDTDYAKTLIGKSVWAWATEVKIIKLGKIPEGEENGMDSNIH